MCSRQINRQTETYLLLSDDLLDNRLSLHFAFDWRLIGPRARSDGLTELALGRGYDLDLSDCCLLRDL